MANLECRTENYGTSQYWVIETRLYR